MSKTISWLCLCLLGVGCLQVKEYALDEVPTQLVVNGLFSPDSTWKVNVSLTGNALSDSAFFLPYVSDAVVQLWEGETYLGELAYAGLGNYRLGRYPRPEVDYSLKVWAPGFDTVTARSRIPAAPAPFSAHWAKEEVVRFADRFGGVYKASPLRFSLTDPPGVPNYYLLGTAYYDSCICVINRDSPAVEDRLRDRLKSGGIYGDYIAGAIFADQRRVLLPDIGFDGQAVSLTAHMPDTSEVFYGINISLDPISDSIPGGRENFALSQRVFVEVYADLWSLSPALYDYLLTYFQQGMGAADPFMTFQPVNGNIQGGLGIFAGYHRHLIPIHLDE